VYGYVATQIRYIGVAFGVGRYQPHPASEVLRNQYGDCKDKHTLLASMLTAAGMHPDAALIGAGIRTNEEVPSPGAFNHMITTVPVAGKQVWLDATAEVAPYQMLMSVIRDKQALVVPEAGEAKLEKTPEKLPFTPFSQFVAKGSLTKDGTMKAQMEYTARGDEEVVLRALLKQVPPGQWDELTQRISQGLGFGGTTSHAEAGRPDATADPERLAYNYEREKTGDWDNHRIVALLPVVFLPTIDEKNPPKKVQIQLGEPRVETSRSTIKLPPGWGADLPAAVHEKTAFASFDRTYTVAGDTLTTERRVEIFQREVPAAEWKAYKKWLDATVGDGEPFVQLIDTGTKTADKTPSTPTPPSGETASLLKEVYSQIQRGELNGAEETLNKVRQQESGAIWYFRGMAMLQAMRGKQEEAADAMRRVLKMDGASSADREAAGVMFYQVKLYDEALPLLEEKAKGDADDLQLQIQVGTAQIETGRKAAGGKTLTAALSKATETLMLNDAAYELGEAGIELEQAEKASRQAVEDLTAESMSWVVSASTKGQESKQELLVSSWDTLGWILFREGKLDEADSYVRAAWNNEQTGEIGLHLGEIAEKRGNKKAALDLYEMSLAPMVQKTTSTPEMERTRRALRERADALKKDGVVSTMRDPSASLQHLRMIPLGPWRGKNSSAEYTFVLEQNGMGDLQETSQGVSGISNASSMIRKARFDHWTPTGSEARLLRKSTLNCHGSVCELVVHPM
jgi:tetratricopeptide (TPR) repeat protein